MRLRHRIGRHLNSPSFWYGTFIGLVIGALAWRSPLGGVVLAVLAYAALTFLAKLWEPPPESVSRETLERLKDR